MNYDVNTVLSAMIALGFLALLAPSVFRMNRGTALRNIGIVLASFAVLGLFYKNFGPESAQPLFKMPEAMALRQQAWQKAKDKANTPNPSVGQEEAEPDSSLNNSDEGLDKPSDVIKGI